MGITSVQLHAQLFALLLVTELRSACLRDHYFTDPAVSTFYMNFRTGLSISNKNKKDAEIGYHLKMSTITFEAVHTAVVNWEGSWDLTLLTLFMMLSSSADSWLIVLPGMASNSVAQVICLPAS